MRHCAGSMTVNMQSLIRQNEGMSMPDFKRIRKSADKKNERKSLSKRTRG